MFLLFCVGGGGGGGGGGGEGGGIENYPSIIPVTRVFT